jgi:pseudouridine-5'-phosphate glycosidase
MHVNPSPFAIARPGQQPRCCQVTPFLLERIRTTTGGKSLAANVALVKHNAAVGAAIAAELAAMEATPGGGK